MFSVERWSERKISSIKMKVIEFDETRPESLGAFFYFWGGDDFYLYAAAPAVQMGL